MRDNIQMRFHEIPRILLENRGRVVCTVALIALLLTGVAPQAFAQMDFNDTQTIPGTETPTPLPDPTPLPYPTDSLARMGVAFDGWNPDHTVYPGDSLGNYDLTKIFGAPPYAQGYYDFDNDTTGEANNYGLDYRFNILWGENTSIEDFMGMIKNVPNAIIVVGNEPDHWGQSAKTPEQLAKWYHDTLVKVAEAQQKLKEQDGIEYPVQVALGPVTQPSELRLLYLDRVLATYFELYQEKMPLEVMLVHGYLMPENCGWGIGIPPGMLEYKDLGVPCLAISEVGNVEEFKKRIYGFREWMKENDLQDKPLIVSEWGILLPPAFGWSTAAVAAFLERTTEFMLRTGDVEIGDPADSFRLVYSLYWFSLNAPEMNGQLYDKETKEVTALGLEYAEMTEKIRQQLVATFTPTATATDIFTATPTATVTPTPTSAAVPPATRSIYLPIVVR